MAASNRSRAYNIAGPGNGGSRADFGVADAATGTAGDWLDSTYVRGGPRARLLPCAGVFSGSTAGVHACNPPRQPPHVATHGNPTAPQMRLARIEQKDNQLLGGRGPPLRRLTYAKAEVP